MSEDIYPKYRVQYDCLLEGFVVRRQDSKGGGWRYETSFPFKWMCILYAKRSIKKDAVTRARKVRGDVIVWGPEP